MRSFVAVLVAIGATTATVQATGDYLKCAEAALGGVDASKFNDCTDKSSSDRTAAPARHASKPMEPAMGNMDMSKDMGNMEHKRAYMPDSMAGAESVAPRVVYVTETRTECSCKSTPAPFDPKHMSQIPVNVPTHSSSMMAGMAAASTPGMSMSHGVLVGAASSSVIFRGASATPTPSGASPNRYNSFEGAAPKANALNSAVAALGVAAVMGLMVAL